MRYPVAGTLDLQAIILLITQQQARADATVGSVHPCKVVPKQLRLDRFPAVRCHPLAMGCSGWASVFFGACLSLSSQLCAPTSSQKNSTKARNGRSFFRATPRKTMDTRRKLVKGYAMKGFTSFDGWVLAVT